MEDPGKMIHADLHVLHGFTVTICFLKDNRNIITKRKVTRENAKLGWDACAAGYSIAYYAEKVPADRDWPGIQEAAKDFGDPTLATEWPQQFSERCSDIVHCDTLLYPIFLAFNDTKNVCQMIHAVPPSRGCKLPTTCLQLLDCSFEWRKCDVR